MTSPLPAMSTATRIFNSALRNASVAKQAGVRLGDHYPKEVVDDIFANALKKQTGVSLKYMWVVSNLHILSSLTIFVQQMRLLSTCSNPHPVVQLILFIYPNVVAG